MDVAAAQVTAVPGENLAVRRDLFVAVWSIAERGADWRSYGVAATCRWLACATVRPEGGPWHPAAAPLTQRMGKATPELIEVECLEADLLMMRRPAPAWLAGRPGWLDGVSATLAWAWRGDGIAPLDVGGLVS